jgi:hypothetical protein
MIAERIFYARDNRLFLPQIGGKAIYHETDLPFTAAQNVVEFVIVIRIWR